VEPAAVARVIGGWMGRMAMFALSDAELCVIGKAFDRAWDKFLRTGALTPENFADSRIILAARILRAAYYGERDEWRLARDAVSYLKQVFGVEDAARRRTAGAKAKPRQERRPGGRRAVPGRGEPLHSSPV